MIRMTVTKEVEATAEQVQEMLTEWAGRKDAAKFPFAKGNFIRLTEPLAEALGAHPDAPVLVLGRADTIGVVAFVNNAGNIQPMALQPSQVRGMKDEADEAAADA